LFSREREREREKRILAMWHLDVVVVVVDGSVVVDVVVVVGLLVQRHFFSLSLSGAQLSWESSLS
jgi:hypothetical protein